ncbi:MAG: nuclear transport factor 2 family protein [Rhodospirillales bacterium]|nr:nuclear transport factor 2 family protein [Rhodospirillales bacterium]
MAEPTTESRNESVVRDFIAAWENKDANAIMAAFSPDIVWHNMPMAPIQGLEPIKALVEPFLAASDVVEWKVLRLQGAGDRVYTERVDCFEIGGNRIEVPVAGVFEMDADGKVAAWRDYFDMQTWLDQGGPPFG